MERSIVFGAPHRPHSSLNLAHLCIYLRAWKNCMLCPQNVASGCHRLLKQLMLPATLLQQRNTLHVTGQYEEWGTGENEFKLTNTIQLKCTWQGFPCKKSSASLPVRNQTPNPHSTVKCYRRVSRAGGGAIQAQSLILCFLLFAYVDMK